MKKMKDHGVSRTPKSKKPLPEPQFAPPPGDPPPPPKPPEPIE